MAQPLVSEISKRYKLRLFKKHLKDNSSIIEVGAGSGGFSKQLRKYGYVVTTLFVNTNNTH